MLPRLLFVASCLATAVSTAFAEPVDGLPNPPVGERWKMIWNDEFNGAQLDESKWTHRPEGPHREGWWRNDAVSLDGSGHLVIKVFKEGEEFISGNVISKGKFEHSFGFYVARLQFQRQPGSWSAFWLTNDAVAKSGPDGRNGTEIDIVEKFSSKDRVEHNLHWGGYGAGHQHDGQKVEVAGISEGWHCVGVWWSPEEYVFYVDGKETWRTRSGGVGQVPLYLLFTNEIGPSAGDIKQAKLPDTFQVDYVRVYDLEKQ